MNIMRRIFIILAASQLCMLSGCVNSSTNNNISPAPSYPVWRKFVSEKCKFSVLLPGIPESVNAAIKGKAGTAHSENFMLSARQGNDISSYSIYCAQYPLGHLSKFDSYGFLETTWKNRFSDMKSRLVYKKRIRLNNFSAIEFQYKAKGNSTSLTTTRYYLANDRTYLVTVGTPRVGLERGYANKFLNSFKIIQ